MPKPGYYSQHHYEKGMRSQSTALSYSNMPDVDLSYYEHSNHNETCCSLCKRSSAIFDYNTGEIICNICGMVIHDNMESLEPEWRTFSDRGTKEINSKVRAGRPISLALYDMGLSTQISYSNLDAKGDAINATQTPIIKRIRRWDKISSFDNNNSARNLKYAFEIMSRIKDKLSLTDVVIEKAAYIYRRALVKKLIQGRSTESMVVACVYAACRKLNIPRKLDEISGTINDDKIFAGKCYRLLLKDLKIQNIPITDSTNYLSKIASKAKVSEKTYRLALEMLTKVKKNHMSYGKDPSALTAAVLYAACQKEGEKMTQAQLAYAGNTSAVSIRHRFTDIKQILK
ncbi:MAG TPA: TFIIB-type zinc ribbon-containing protein [Nitrososphaeraceae archaeon]